MKFPYRRAPDRQTRDRKDKIVNVGTALRVVREPKAAGRFYPAEKAFLAKLVDGYLAEARLPAEIPKAVIAPHAGYIYSGAVAGSAFARWQQLSNQIERVVLIGPSHFYDFPGMAVPEASAFETPLGEVPVDEEPVRRIRELKGVWAFELPHQPEHALEVELPFLQQVLGQFSVVPILVSRADDAHVSAVIDLLWGGPETVIVISSDLSHYHDYGTAQKMDANTAQCIERLDGLSLKSDQACGYRAIRGFLKSARKRAVRGTTIDLRNSGDTAGPTSEVVGYGAFHFCE